MAENENTPTPKIELIEESRSLTAAAVVAMPVAILAQPIVGAWASQHFSDNPKEPPAKKD